MPGLITEGRYNEAMRMRGRSFVEMDAIFTELSEPARTTSDTAGDADRKRVAIMHAGGPAPGMNTAARVQCDWRFPAVIPLWESITGSSD